MSKEYAIGFGSNQKRSVHQIIFDEFAIDLMVKYNIIQKLLENVSGVGKLGFNLEDGNDVYLCISLSDTEYIKSGNGDIVEVPLKNMLYNHIMKALEKCMMDSDVSPKDRIEFICTIANTLVIQFKENEECNMIFLDTNTFGSAFESITGFKIPNFEEGENE